MSEEIKKELTDEELDNVAGAGKLDDLYQLIKSNPAKEREFIRAAQRGGRVALVPEIIKYCDETGNHYLSYLANDVLGLLDFDWRQKGYFAKNMFREPKNFI